jgi:hypothetical protein
MEVKSANMVEEKMNVMKVIVMEVGSANIIKEKMNVLSVGVLVYVFIVNIFK